MAGARAATSLSLTIGVAFVTVVVMGGILAGPAIVDCSHQPQSFGACLRDHLDRSHLLPATDAPSQVPELSSESAPPPSLPPTLPSTVAEVSPHEDGWLDARANEYQPPGVSALEPPQPPALPPLAAPPAGETASSAVAEIEVTPPPLPHPRPAVTLKPKADVKKPVAKPARVARLAPRPVRPRALPIFKNDPRFPNVIVLSPPARGSNSSFVTLETR